MTNPEHILKEWNACRDWLVPALVEDEEGDVINELLTNRAQLWRGRRSALVTKLTLTTTEHRPQEPCVVVWLGGGDIDELLEMRPGVEAWARWQGAKAARINGRPGWTRQLKAWGFEPDGDELRKEL